LRTKTVRTHTHTDRHTPMTTRPCGLRRAGNNVIHAVAAETEKFSEVAGMY